MEPKAPADRERARDQALEARHDDALRDLASEEPLRFEVRGSSMEPLLKDRTKVDIAPAGIYWPGDVVAFRRGDGRVLVHRVIGWVRRRGEMMVVLQGDAMSDPDTPVSRGRVLGRVCGGECPERVAHPSVLDRATALLRFSRAALRKGVRA